jgi:hypothetical protein
MKMDKQAASCPTLAIFCPLIICATATIGSCTSFDDDQNARIAHYARASPRNDKLLMQDRAKSLRTAQVRRRF